MQGEEEGILSSLERRMNDFLASEKFLRETYCFLGIKPLARVNYNRKESCVSPNIQGDAGVNQRDECVITPIYRFPPFSSRIYYRLPVSPQTEGFRNILKKTVYRSPINFDFEKTLYEQTLSSYVRGKVLHEIAWVLK